VQPLRVLASDRDGGYHRVIYDALASHVVERHLDSGAAEDLNRIGTMLARSDVFHLHWPELALGSDERRHEDLIAALARAGVPVVWTQHNLVPHSWGNAMAAVYERWAGVADGVIHHSRWGERQVRSRYRFNRNAVHRVIPHPHFGPLIEQEVRTRTQIERQLGLSSEVLRLGLIGAPRDERDVHLAARAVTQCQRDDIELFVASLRPDDTLPHDRRVVCQPHGRVSRPLYDARLRVMDALVMPIRSGNMLTTGTIGDAVAHGLPCLISDWPFLAETLGAAGIAYGRTADDLARCIETLTDSKLRTARRHAVALRRQTDPTRVAQLNLALLAEVALRRNQAPTSATKPIRWPSGEPNPSFGSHPSGDPSVGHL
jgi:glycosyltransferase involved in cell wall biosynthesis